MSTPRGVDSTCDMSHIMSTHFPASQCPGSYHSHRITLFSRPAAYERRCLSAAQRAPWAELCARAAPQEADEAAAHGTQSR